jgi:hypothetical protein
MKIKLLALGLGLLLTTSSVFAASTDMPVKTEKKHVSSKKHVIAKKHVKTKKHLVAKKHVKNQKKAIVS